MERSVRLLLCFCLALAGRAQTFTVSAANLQINPAGTDTYSIQGSLNGMSLDNAQAIVFSIGQFGAAIPLTAFVQQTGTNVYQYTDTTGLTPYWVSSLTVDLDGNAFSASSSGVVLSGLGNPFAVVIGTDVGTACGVVRMQNVSPGQYQLNPNDPPTQPCAFAGSPLADPPVVPAGSTGQFTVTVAASGLDAGSAALFQADDNAQPTNLPLCTFTDNGDGTLSCTAALSQANAGPVPLLVQATVGGAPVLAPGFAVQAVAPISDADMQQLSDIQNLVLSAGDQAYGQYGDSVYSRIQVLAALRQFKQAPLGLTGQPVSLSPDGFEIDVLCDSGIPVNYVIGDPDDTDLTQLAPQLARVGQAQVDQSQVDQSSAPRTGRGTTAAAGPARFPVHSQIHANAVTPEECGDYQRQIIGGNQVMVWDPGSLFFGTGDAAPFVANVSQRSLCPNFQPPFTLMGNQADSASVSQFANFNTVIMNTHGGLDKNNRFFIVTGEPSTTSKDYWGEPNGPFIAKGTSCFRLLRGVLPEANPTRCYVSLYANFGGWQVAPNSIVYGGFCNGYSATLPGKFVLIGGYASPVGVLSPWPGVFAQGANNAYVGYSSVISTLEDYNSGIAFFTNLINSYQDVYDAVDNSSDPKMNPSPNGQNLAYVGNPHLSLTSLTPNIGGSQVLAAFLEGTATCGQNLSGNGTDYLHVQWKNPATAGHLAGLTGGSQDNFMNPANCDDSSSPACDPTQVTLLPAVPSPVLVRDWALAQYTPDGTLSGTSDNITADFYPNQNGKSVARACVTAQGNPGLFVDTQLATVWDDSNPSQRGYGISLFPPAKVTQTYNVPLSDPGGNAGKGGTASVTITPNGPGSWTLTVSAGGADPNWNQHITLGSGLGPYYGLAQIVLTAVNPGPVGKAQVKISGTINNPDLTVTEGNTKLTTAPGGTINITDSQGARLLSGSLDPLDPSAVTNVSVMGSSSCTGQQGPYCGVNISISLGEDLVVAPTPSNATITLTIQFVNQ